MRGSLRRATIGRLKSAGTGFLAGLAVALVALPAVWWLRPEFSADEAMVFVAVPIVLAFLAFRAIAALAAKLPDSESKDEPVLALAFVGVLALLVLIAGVALLAMPAYWAIGMAWAVELASYIVAGALGGVLFLVGGLLVFANTEEQRRTLAEELGRSALTLAHR